LLPAMLLLYFFKRKKRMLGIGLSAAIVGGLLLIMFLIPETKMRLEKMQSQMDETYSNEAPNSVTLRKVIWESAFEIISEHWLTGVGTGDANNELKIRYREKHLTWPLNDNLNAHNQYLQTAIAIGISGLLVLVASFIAGFRVSVIRKEYLYAVFLALFILCIITECMLEEEAGVVFFAYFNSLLANKALNITH
jgi:O-antigen ligase